MLFCLAQVNETSAQCPGCAVNMACYVPGGGLCPDSLPGGTQGQPYDTDVTCYLPSTIDAGPFSGGVLGIVPLESVHIDAISGLPFGLSWTCNHPGNNFYPASGDTMGCVKICGTPISAPGVYNIVVTVTAGVDAGALGTQYAQTTFGFQMVIFANSSGNLAFSYSPSSACDTGWITYTPIITATLPQVVQYNWDFGNGNTYSGATPPAQFYNAPGNYPVTCTTEIYNLTLTAASANAAGNWWCGDVEETNWPIVGCTAAPDLYFKFTHGSQTYVSSSGSDQTSNVWANLNVVLSGTSVAMSVWDEDAVSADDDGGTYTTTVNGPGLYGYTANSPWGGTSSGTFTISLTLDTTITVTDTIRIYPLPTQPTITASANDFCPGDSVILSTYPGYSYEWYQDSLLVQSGPSEQLVVHTPGDFYVIVFDPATGCASVGSTPVTIVQNPAIPFNFAITWNAAGGYMASNLSGTYSYQWQQYNGSTWVNIAPPAGVQSTYTPSANGQFRLIATNGTGCTDTTATYNYNTFGVPDLDMEYQIGIFPNPSDGNFTLTMNMPSATDVRMSIFDMVGKEIYTQNMEQVSGVNNRQISLQGLSAGSYILDLSFPEGSVRRKLIIR